jgi:DNA-binding SARP family transcriptional activator
MWCLRYIGLLLVGMSSRSSQRVTCWSRRVTTGSRVVTSGSLTRPAGTAKLRCFTALRGGYTVSRVGDQLRVGLLGPFELRHGGGEPLALGGLRQRALLAILALPPNEVVSTDRLIDSLWGESPPSDATHTVRVFVSRLRQALGPSRGRLVTIAPGYRLTLDAVEIDAERSERLYNEARAAMAALRPADAAAKLSEALALWRGPPLADFTYEAFAQGTIARLEELRVCCREELVEAQLALGHHTEVVQALEVLIAQHPVRERPRGQLMLALYRCGRQAEALDAYQQARHMLVEKLAIEPSGALRRLEQAILEQDPALSVPAASDGGQPVSTDPPFADADVNRDERLETVFTSADRRPATISPRTAAGAFVGRGDCVERLRVRWHESRDGRTNLVWLAGPAGIGKTRLAMQFADEVQRDGGMALYGRADAESLLPYQPVAEALDDLMSGAGSRLEVAAKRELETLSRPFPNLRRYSPAAAAADDRDTMRYEVFEAVVSVLVRASADTPLLVVQDDLQWADQPTLLLLRHFLRRAEGARLLVIGAFRSDEPSQSLTEVLADLRRERLHDRLSLTGLADEATSRLVTERLDRAGVEVTPAFIHRLHRQTEGNPFFIEETLQALAESKLAQGGMVDQDALDALGVPEGVAEVIMRRVKKLTPLTQELLVIASVMGPVWNLRFVEDLIRAERADFGEEMDAAPIDAIAAAVEEAAGLVLELPDQFEVLTFAHALVREVLYASLAGGRRIRLHHRVAEALDRLSEHADVNPAELAHHFLMAKPIAGPERARKYAIVAGRRAAKQFAYEEAAEQLRRAVALSEKDDEAGRCDILLELGRVQWHIGDEGARSTFLTAAKSAEGRDARQLAWAAIGLGERYFEITYEGARYLDWLEKAQTALPTDDSHVRVVLLSRLAVNLSFPYENERGQAIAADAVAMARRRGDERTLAVALLARQITLLDVRHIEQRLALDQELGSLAGGHEELAAEVHHWRMYDLLGVGDLNGARHEATELDRLAEKLGQPLLRSLALGARGVWAEIAGDDDEAERWADLSLQQARIAHTHDADSSWGSQVFALRRRQGRIAELSSQVESIVDAGGQPLGWVGALGVLRLESGDEAAARALYEQEMGDGPANLPRGMFWLTRMALLSELCAGLGDVAGAEQLYALLLPHAARNVVVAYCSFWGPVEGYLARLAATFMDRALAMQHAGAARDRAAAIGAPVIARELQRRQLEMQLAT